MKNFKTICFITGIVVLVLAIFLRVDLFLYGADIHSDEAKLALNIIKSDYWQLFKPLDGLQVAPYIFLVLSKLFYNVVYLHYTPKFSDIALRIVPLFSGLAAIPAFWYLLNKLYKNRFVTLVGVSILALNQVCVSYCTIFKQYSFEMLVLILLIILFLKIDFENKDLKYNVKIFILIGLSLFCSMTAVYVIPAGFLYLLLGTKNKENRKQLLICSIIFIGIFAIYFEKFLLPVLNVQYSGMKEYWSDRMIFNKSLYYFISGYVMQMFRTSNLYIINFVSISFIVGLLTMICKNIRTAVITAFPIITVYIFVIMNNYPFSERLLLFTLPCFILVLVYLISLIPQKFLYKNTVLVFVLLSCFIALNLRFFPDNTGLNSKNHVSRTAWIFMKKCINPKSKIIVAPSIPTIKYYMAIDKVKYQYDTIEEAEEKGLSKNTYNIICTNYDIKNKRRIDNLIKDSEILVYKYFKNPSSFKHKERQGAVYIKFRVKK